MGLVFRVKTKESFSVLSIRQTILLVEVSEVQV